MKNRFWPVSIALLCVTLLVAIATAVWSLAREQEKSTSKQPEVANNSSLVDNTSTRAEGGELHSYESMEFGYALDFPSDWSRDTVNSTAFRRPTVTLTSKDTLSQISAGGFPSPDISIIDYDSVSELYTSQEPPRTPTLREYLEGRQGPGNVLRFVDYSVNGVEGYIVEAGGSASSVAVYLEHEGNVHVILFERKGTYAELSGEEIAILNSIRFR